MAESKKSSAETKVVTALCDQNCNPELNKGMKRVKKGEKFTVLESKRKFLSVHTDNQLKAIEHNKKVLEKAKGKGTQHVPKGSLKNINKIED